MQSGMTVYVFQTGRKFVAGTRKELRSINKAGRKQLKRTTGSHLLNYDYRNSVVYVTGYRPNS
jgi:hypothetical protein